MREEKQKEEEERRGKDDYYTKVRAYIYIYRAR